MAHHQQSVGSVVLPQEDLIREVIPLVGNRKVARFHLGNIEQLVGRLDIDLLTRSLNSGKDWLSIVRGGQTLHHATWTNDEGGPDEEAVAKAYHQGHTLLMRRMHLRHESIAKVCRRVDSVLLAAGLVPRRPTRSNLFASPANTAGLARHWDDHDVVVLHVSGEKHWIVHEGAVRFPLEPPQAPVEDEEAGLPVFNDKLCSGDVLFIPRGFPHATRTDGTHSIHITLGIDIVKWVDVIVAAAAHCEPLRRNLPARAWKAEGSARTDLTEGVIPSPDEPSVRRAVADLLSDFLARSGSRNPTEWWSNRRVPLTLETIVRRRREALHALVAIEPESLEWATHGLTLSSAGELGDLLRFLDATPEQFSVLELPTASHDLKLAMADQLVRAGFLEVVEGSE